MKRKITALLLIVAMVVTMWGQPAPFANAQTTIKLSCSQMSLVEKEVLRLYVTGSSKKVTFTSSNKKTATVSSAGIVEAKKAGSATITAKIAGKTLKCKITVFPYVSQRDREYLRLAVNSVKGISHATEKTYTLDSVSTGIYDPNPYESLEDLTYKFAMRLSCKGANGSTDYLTVLCGKNMATTIQASNFTGKNEVKYSATKFKNFKKLYDAIMSGKYDLSHNSGFKSLNLFKGSLFKGDEYQLKIINATKSVTWKSSNTSVATVKNGKLTAINPGDVTISAKEDGVTYKCTVTVLPDYDKTTRATLFLLGFVSPRLIDKDSIRIERIGVSNSPNARALLQLSGLSNRGNQYTSYYDIDFIDESSFHLGWSRKEFLGVNFSLYSKYLSQSDVDAIQDYFKKGALDTILINL